jgi:hypothetical protein
MGEPDKEPIQIIANEEHIYDVGDVAIVALDGAVLKDGTRIKPTRLRKLKSYGMAMGKTDKPVGHDFSTEYERPKPKGFQLVKWPHIEQFHNIRRGIVEACAETGETPPKIKYKAKVKLDGTNGGVQVKPDGSIAAQSHATVLNGHDNYEFSAWVHSQYEHFETIGKYLKLSENNKELTIFGEWCGKGIQKRTAVSQIGKRIFAVFAARLGDIYIIEPSDLKILVGQHEDIYVIPWVDDFEIEIDYGDNDNLEASAKTLNELVAKIEACDPWVNLVFSVSGMGEGVVLYPTSLAKKDHSIDCMDLSEYMFKAKGEKHQVVKQKEAVILDPERVASVSEFVAKFVTEQRLEQALQEACDGKVDIKLTGKFIKWIGNDVMRESEDELSASGLVWKDVGKQVGKAAQTWYMDKVKSI